MCLEHHLKPCYWYCEVYDVTFRLQQIIQPQGDPSADRFTPPSNVDILKLGLGLGLGLGFLFFFVCEWIPQIHFKDQHQLGHCLTHQRRVRYMHCSRKSRCLPGPPHIDRVSQLASIPPPIRMRYNITSAPVAIPHYGIERGK